MKIGTLQCEIPRLKIQTTIGISKSVVSPSLTPFETESQTERTGSLLCDHKCAKMVATISMLPFCTEVLEKSEGQIFSSLRYLDSSTTTFIINVLSLDATACKQLSSNHKTALFDIMERHLRNS